MRTLALALSLLTLLTLPVAAQEDPIAEAKKALASKDYSRGLEICNDAWDKVKADADGLEVMLECALRSGELGIATDVGVRLTGLDAKRAKAWKLTAEAFYWRGEALKNDPSANSGTVRGYFEESAGLAKSYLELKPEDDEAWALRGHALYWAEQQESAAASFEKAAGLKPKNADYHYFAARSHGIAGNAAAQSKLLDKATSLAPDKGYLWKAYGDAVGQGLNEPERAAGLYGKALAAKELSDDVANQAATAIWQILGGASKFAEGLVHIEAWTKAHARSLSAWWWRGYWEMQAGEVDAAIASFEKCWDVSGKSQADAAAFIGDLHARKALPMDSNGQADASRLDIKGYEKAAEWYMNAESVSGWNWGNDPWQRPVRRCVALFGFMAGNGHLDAGAKLLEEVVLPRKKDDWQVLNNLGLYYRDTGGARGSRPMCDKSRKYYDAAAPAVLADASATPENKARVLNDAGVLYHFPRYRGVDLDKAVDYYRQALAQNAKKDDIGYTDPNENMGLILLEAGQFKEALAHFEKVLAEEPNRRVSLNGKRRAEAGLK